MTDERKPKMFSGEGLMPVESTGDGTIFGKVRVPAILRPNLQAFPHLDHHHWISAVYEGSEETVKKDARASQEPTTGATAGHLPGTSTWSPLGVPLGSIEAALAQTSLKSDREGDTLVVHHEKVTTRVEVLEPAVDRGSEEPPTRAVIAVTTDVPWGRGSAEPLTVAARANGLATLGAVTVEGERMYVGSRITTYDDKEWSLYQPLLGAAICAAGDDISGAHAHLEARGSSQEDRSLWTRDDIEQIAAELESRSTMRSVEEGGLLTEFGMKLGAHNSKNRDPVAFWLLSTAQPHPAMGSGLLCTLYFPHPWDARTSVEIVNRLNVVEMHNHTRPPHLGAWTVRPTGATMAYVTFIPNSLYWVKGLALHVSSWGFARALLVSSTFAALGV